MQPKAILSSALVLLGGSCASLPEAQFTDLRVLSYNIRHGEGNDGVIDLSRAAEVIRRSRADLVLLQEIDKGARRTGQADQMALLAEMTGLTARFGAFMKFQGGEYGMGLLSRFPILASKNHILPRGAEARSALDARVRLPNGQDLLVCDVHFYRSQEERLAQARKVQQIYADVKLPMILAGDFNSTPGSAVMRFVERYWTNTDKGEDHLTWPSGDARTEIDFVLYRPAGRFELLSAEVLDEGLASDHRPVLVTLRLRSQDLRAVGLRCERRSSTPNRWKAAASVIDDRASETARIERARHRAFSRFVAQN